MFLFLRQSRLSAPTRARFDSPGRLALGWAGEINEKPQRGEIPAFKPRSRPRWNLAPLGLGSPLHLRYPGLTRAGLSNFAPFGADWWSAGIKPGCIPTNRTVQFYAVQALPRVRPTVRNGVR